MSSAAFRHDGRIRVPALYATPCMKFDLDAEIRRMEAEQPWQAGHTARTIAKYPDLRLVLVVMKAGSRLVEHRTSGRISVQVLAGLIRVNACGEGTQMPAGSLLTMDRDMVHDVEAIEDSAFLLTIAWPEHQPAAAEVVPRLCSRYTAEYATPSVWQNAGPDSVAIDSYPKPRERGLDTTLADTFPCSDPLSSIPNPAMLKLG